jgi:hypothetical protein
MAALAVFSIPDGLTLGFFAGGRLAGGGGVARAPAASADLRFLLEVPLELASAGVFLAPAWVPASGVFDFWMTNQPLLGANKRHGRGFTNLSSKDRVGVARRADGPPNSGHRAAVDTKDTSS